jgi:HEPN domain-containing protein
MPDKDLLLDWIRHATNDLIVARHSFDDLYPKQTEIAVYLCQQCAEKALKAYLVFNDIDPPWIHDLIKLLRMCKSIDTDFSLLETYCKRLNPFGAATRYPNELAADEPVAKAAIEDAQKIYDLCVAKMPVP